MPLSKRKGGPHCRKCGREQCGDRLKKPHFDLRTHYMSEEEIVRNKCPSFISKDSVALMPSPKSPIRR